MFPQRDTFTRPMLLVALLAPLALFAFLALLAPLDLRALLALLAPLALQATII